MEGLRKAINDLQNFINNANNQVTNNFIAVLCSNAIFQQQLLNLLNNVVNELSKLESLLELKREK